MTLTYVGDGYTGCNGASAQQSEKEAALFAGIGETGLVLLRALGQQRLLSTETDGAAVFVADVGQPVVSKGIRKRLP